jgi:porin
VVTALLIAGAITGRLAAQPEYSPIENVAVANVLEAASPEPGLVSNLHPGCDSGILFEPVYIGEVFTNARGGISTEDATQYQALFDLATTVEFEKLRIPLPGKFFMLAQTTHGRGLTEDFVGDAQVLSNIDSGDNITRVNEYWWEFSLLDENVTVRLGKQDLNTEFLYMDTAADFVQSAFGLTPALVLPTYPDPSMGAVVLAQLTDAWQLKLGVWDAFAFGGRWGISGNNTVLAVGELEYVYALICESLTGTLAMGAGYLSDGELEGAALDASSGYYLQLEQQVYRECVCDPCNSQGLAVFAAYYPRFLGATKLAEGIGDSAVAGLVYQGLLPGRDEDLFGAGMTWAELSRGGTNQETVFEVFYKVEVSSHLSLQPDLQYIVTPSGIHRDAVAVGVRFTMEL